MRITNRNKVVKFSLMWSILIISSGFVQAQELKNDFEGRTYFEIKYKPFDKFKIQLVPEIRLDEDFSIGRYLLESEAIYEPVDFLSLSAAYRFIVNPRETTSTEYLHRFALSAKASKELGRFEPAIRLRYSNYADDETTDKEFLRYKASLKYDIASCKFTPVIAAEAFQQLSENVLYKMRYTLGVDYKLKNNNYISFSYQLDYYQHELRNKHLINLGYKIKF